MENFQQRYVRLDQLFSDLRRLRVETVERETALRSQIQQEQNQLSHEELAAYYAQAQQEVLKQ